MLSPTHSNAPPANVRPSSPIPNRVEEMRTATPDAEDEGDTELEVPRRLPRERHRDYRQEYAVYLKINSQLRFPVTLSPLVSFVC